MTSIATEENDRYDCGPSCDKCGFVLVDGDLDDYDEANPLCMSCRPKIAMKKCEHSECDYEAPEDEYFNKVWIKGCDTMICHTCYDAICAADDDEESCSADDDEESCSADDDEESCSACGQVSEAEIKD